MLKRPCSSDSHNSSGQSCLYGGVQDMQQTEQVMPILSRLCPYWAVYVHPEQFMPILSTLCPYWAGYAHTEQFMPILAGYVHPEQFMPILSRLCPSWAGYVHPEQFMPILSTLCPSWAVYAQTEQFMPRLSRLCPDWARYVHTEQFMPRLSRLCPYWAGYAHTEQFMSILSSLCQYWAGYAHTEQVMAILCAKCMFERLAPVSSIISPSTNNLSSDSSILESFKRQYSAQTIPTHFWRTSTRGPCNLPLFKDIKVNNRLHLPSSRLTFLGTGWVTGINKPLVRSRQTLSRQSNPQASTRGQI